MKSSMHCLLSAVLFLSSCGYQFSQGTIPSVYKTVSIPFACGDEDGSFTSLLIKEIETNQGLTYVDNCGQLQLQVNLLNIYDQDIGFRFERNRKGKIINSLVPAEARIFIVGEIKLVETFTGKVVLGPVQVITSVEFDHDYYDGIDTFSLGQLTDLDAARDVVKIPLYRALAQKIVEYINQSW